MATTMWRLAYRPWSTMWLLAAIAAVVLTSLEEENGTTGAHKKIYGATIEAVFSNSKIMKDLEEHTKLLHLKSKALFYAESVNLPLLAKESMLVDVQDFVDRRERLVSQLKKNVENVESKGGKEIDIDESGVDEHKTSNSTSSDGSITSDRKDQSVEIDTNGEQDSTTQSSIKSTLRTTEPTMPSKEYLEPSTPLERPSGFTENNAKSETRSVESEGIPDEPQSKTPDDSFVVFGENLELENELSCEHVTNFYEPRWLKMVVRCPTSWTNRTISERCENWERKFPTNYLAFITRLPVQDTSGVVYANIECAQCHQVSEIYPWTLDFRCDRMNKSVLQDFPKTLNVSADAPHLSNLLQPCNQTIQPAFPKALQSCNVSSEWWSRQTRKDETGELVNLNGFPTNTFENVETTYPVSFTILMNFDFSGNTHLMFSAGQRVVTTERIPRCKDTETFDPYNQMCRAMTCSEYHTLIDGRCVPLANDSNAKELGEITSLQQLRSIEQAALVSLQVNITYGDYLLLQDAQFEKDMAKQIAGHLNISTQRIADINITYEFGVINGSDFHVSTLTAEQYKEIFPNQKDDPVAQGEDNGDDEAVPDKAIADKAVPDKAVPDKAVPDKAVPDKAAPDKGDESETAEENWSTDCAIGRNRIVSPPQWAYRENLNGVPGKGTVKTYREAVDVTRERKAEDRKKALKNQIAKNEDKTSDKQGGKQAMKISHEKTGSEQEDVDSTDQSKKLKTEKTKTGANSKYGNKFSMPLYPGYGTPSKQVTDVASTPASGTTDESDSNNFSTQRIEKRSLANEKLETNVPTEDDFARSDDEDVVRNGTSYYMSVKHTLDSGGTLHIIVKERDPNMKNYVDENTQYIRLIQTPYENFYEYHVEAENYTTVLYISEPVNPKEERLIVETSCLRDVLRKQMVMKITFVLLPPQHDNDHEEGAQRVLKRIIDLVVERRFSLRVNGNEFKVVEVDDEGKNMLSAKEFCPLGVELVVYDDEFEILNLDNMTLMYVKEVNTYIGVGRFDLFYILSGSKNDNDTETVNMLKYAFVCFMPRISQRDCNRITLSQDEYQSMGENRSISFRGKEYDILSYAITNETSREIQICVPSSFTDKQHNTYPHISTIDPGCGHTFDKVLQAESYLTIILGRVSMVALAVVFLTYCIFSKLRNLPGMNTMNLTLALFIAEVIFVEGVAVETPWLCTGVAISVHYFFLAAHFWMNVMSFDVYRTFAKRSVLTRMTENKKYFPRYAIYAWGVPCIIVAFCIFIDFSDFFGFAIGYGPVVITATSAGLGNYSLSNSSFESFENGDKNQNSGTPQNMSLLNPGSNYGYARATGCWISNPLATLIAFGAPILLIFLCNCTFFVRTILSISRTAKLSKQSLGLRHSNSSLQKMSGRSDVMLYVRMSTVMGFTWFFGLSSSILSSFAKPITHTACIVSHVQGILFTIFNISQGIFIFAVFVCNRRVFRLYLDLLKKFHRCLIKQSPRSMVFSLSSTLSTISSASSTSTVLSYTIKPKVDGAVIDKHFIKGAISKK